MAPFHAMLEEREFKLLQNVFYFCQLEAQGLDTESVRKVSRTIPLNKVADGVRALGWFPSELQIEELLTEVKFSQFHKTQEQVKEVDLDDFIKLYLNHRPGKISASARLAAETLHFKKCRKGVFYK